MTLPQAAGVAFLSLFVAIDPPMAVPFFLSITDGSSARKRNSLMKEALAVALTVSLLFLMGGGFLFHAIGVGENDLRVGGGLLLLVIGCSSFLITKRDRDVESIEDAGVVPLAIPLIIGPAALTTIMVEAKSLGFVPTFFGILANLLLVWAFLKHADLVLKIIGPKGIRVLAKLSTLLLVMIAVMMIRVGITNLLVSART